MSFKLDQSAIDWIDRLASERGENRSQTIRALLSYASRMPGGWRPPKPTRPAATPRADEPFQCQLGHRTPVMVTDSTYRQHVKRAHRAEARELGWLK